MRTMGRLLHMCAEHYTPEQIADEIRKAVR